MTLDKYKIFTEEIKAEMVGTQGKVTIFDNGVAVTMPSNIHDGNVVASVSYDCSETESTDDLSIDFIDSLFDSLLEQVQN